MEVITNGSINTTTNTRTLRKNSSSNKNTNRQRHQLQRQHHQCNNQHRRCIHKCESNLPTTQRRNTLPICKSHNKTKQSQIQTRRHYQYCDNMKKNTNFCDGCCYRITCDGDLEKCCYLQTRTNKCVLESDNQ